MKSLLSILGLLCALLLAAGRGVVSAQTIGPIQNPQNQLQQINGPVSSASSSSNPSALPATTSDLAGLDLVNQYPVPNTLTLSTDQSVFFTDNAFLTHNNDVSSFGYNGRLRATYIPYSLRDWTPSISFEQQFIRYDHTSILDFDAQTVQVASKYDIFKDKSLSWTASYSLQRLYTDRASLGEFYKESFFDNGLAYVKPIFGQQNLFFFGAYDIGWRLTDPQLYSRVDNSLLFSVVYLPVPQVRIQPYLRPAIYAYTDNEEISPTTGTLVYRSRTDYDVALGVNASYFPIKEIALNASVNWTGNYSNVGDREYTVTTPVLGVSGTIGFW